MSVAIIETARISDFFVPAGSKCDSGVADLLMAKLKENKLPFASPSQLRNIGQIIFKRYVDEDVGETDWPQGDDDRAKIEKERLGKQLASAIEVSTAAATARIGLPLNATLCDNHILSAQVFIFHLERANQAGLPFGNTNHIANARDVIEGHVKEAQNLGFNDGANEFGKERLQAAVDSAHLTSLAHYWSHGKIPVTGTVTDDRIIKAEIERLQSIARGLLNGSASLFVTTNKAAQRRIDSMLRHLRAADPAPKIGG